MTVQKETAAAPFSESMPPETPGRNAEPQDEPVEQRAPPRTPTGRPLGPTKLTRRFGRVLNRAGLRGLHCHDLRHAAATLLWSGASNSS